MSETSRVVAQSREDNSFSQDDKVPEVVENEDGSATVIDFPGKEEKEEGEKSDFYVNLAEEMAESELRSIATELIRLIEQDKETRKKRDEIYAEGLRRSGLGNDAPGGAEFEGASKVVHPVLAEACVDFEARAIKELYPPSGPVKTQMLGGDRTPKRLAIADNKKSTLNWILSKGSPEYKAELEQTISQVPLGGSEYLKVRPDLSANRIKFEFIPIDDMFLAFSSSNFYTAPRATHQQLITRYEFEDRVDSGLYRDIIDIENDNPTIERTAAAEANDKIEGKSVDYYNEDGLRKVFEVTLWYRLDEDEYAEDLVAPYVIHIDEQTEAVLGVYRNWAEGDKYYTKLDWVAEFGLIPWRGAYKLGLPHLIGTLSGAATGALRALLDSAHIANAATVLKLRSPRTSGQNVDVAITQMFEVDAPPNVDDIRKVAMPMPFPGPSPVLLQLLGFLVDAAKGVIATAEEKIADAGNNMPVGTSLALIEQGSKVYASIHSRLHDSQAKVLEIVCRLLAAYPSLLDRAKEVLGDKCASAEDFATTDDICPVSDPNIFSEAQRFAQLQAVTQLQAATPQLPWDVMEINRRALQLLNYPDADGILPPRPDPVTADPVNENAQAILKNAPLKADPSQDHLAHLREHLRFLTDPLQGANPIMPGPPLGALLTHCNEHLVYLYVEHVKTVGPQVTQQTIEAGPQPNPDNISAAAAAMASQHFSQSPVVKQILPLFAQAAQMVKAKQPPQPMDPTQATLQASQAETQRQSERDKSEAQLKQQQMQVEAQQEMHKMQTEMQLAMKNFQAQADKQGQDHAIKMEELKQGWANIEVAAKKVGIERDDEISGLLKQLIEKVGAADPANVVEPLQNQVDALGEDLSATKEAHDDKVGMMQDHHDEVVDLLKENQDGNA